MLSHSLVSVRASAVVVRRRLFLSLNGFQTLFAVILHHKLLPVLIATHMAVLPPENVILRSFLQSGVDSEHPRMNHTAQAHEFDDCRYSMKRHAASVARIVLCL